MKQPTESIHAPDSTQAQPEEAGSRRQSSPAAELPVEQRMVQIPGTSVLIPQPDPRPVHPTGGDPKDFCECDHHEMNHANYAGLPRACNQTGCECNSYRPVHREEPQIAYMPPMQDKRFHFETEQVMEALVGTDYLRGEVHQHLHHMTSGERWSLYRAIVKLATPPSIDTREPAELPGKVALPPLEYMGAKELRIRLADALQKIEELQQACKSWQDSFGRVIETGKEFLQRAELAESQLAERDRRLGEAAIMLRATLTECSFSTVERHVEIGTWLDKLLTGGTA